MQQKSDSQRFENFYFQWHITDKCNFRCSHCYQTTYADSSEMSLTELIEIANRLFFTLSKWKKKGDISVTGGEPFLRKDLFAFLEYLDSSDGVSNLDILCNGTLITNQSAQRLKEITKLKRIQISLDGASPITHNKIRGHYAFEKAIRGIRILADYDFDVKVMFTLQRDNMSDISSLIDLAINENISGLTIERMVPMGSARNISESLLSTEELRDSFQVHF